MSTTAENAGVRKTATGDLPAPPVAATQKLLTSSQAAGAWGGGRGSNLLDGGHPLYGCYACADGKYLALGAIEPQFRAALSAGLGLSEGADHAAVAAAVATRSRDAWLALFAGKDACVAPILDLDEAPAHPHNKARGTFEAVGGVIQPMPAPRYKGKGGSTPLPPRRNGEDGAAILKELGYPNSEIADLLNS